MRMLPSSVSSSARTIQTVSLDFLPLRRTVSPRKSCNSSIFANEEWGHMISMVTRLLAEYLVRGRPQSYHRSWLHRRLVGWEPSFGPWCRCSFHPCRPWFFEASMWVDWRSPEAEVSAGGLEACPELWSARVAVAAESEESFGFAEYSATIAHTLCYCLSGVAAALETENNEK